MGGCREYTGAPYFGAYTALRVGAAVCGLWRAWIERGDDGGVFFGWTGVVCRAGYSSGL